MEKIFQLAAVIFAGIAAFFLWRGNADWLFFFAVLGAVCFFLGIRFQVGARVKQRRKEEEKSREDEEKRSEEEMRDAETPELISSAVIDKRRTTNDEPQIKV